MADDLPMPISSLRAGPIFSPPRALSPTLTSHTTPCPPRDFQTAIHTHSHLHLLAPAHTSSDQRKYSYSHRVFLRIISVFQKKTETAAATAAASGEAGTSAAAAAAFRAAGTSKISIGSKGSGSTHTKGQRGSGSGSQMQHPQQEVPALHMHAAQGKRSVQKQVPQDEHQPLASHQQRMLQTEEAACKKEAEVRLFV